MSLSFKFRPFRLRPSTAARLRALISCTLMLAFCASAGAETAITPAQQSSPPITSFLPDAPLPQGQDKDAVTLRSTPVQILTDQAAIWTSPLRLKMHDVLWLAPLAAATGAGIATDHHAMASVVSRSTDFNQANLDASNVMIGGFIATPVVLYGLGHYRQDAHAREAGILGGEAILDGILVEQGLKLIFWRERPAMDNAHGLFFQGSAGPDSSFPSSHSVLAWSAAALIAGEYPSRWTQLGVYSLATGVSVTRVLGQAHFPTDVLVGSAAGWLVGRYVYRVHHKNSRAAAHR
jgi:hypothetical protein